MGPISLLEQLTELRIPVYQQDYQFIIKDVTEEKQPDGKDIQGKV